MQFNQIPIRINKEVVSKVWIHLFHVKQFFEIFEYWMSLWTIYLDWFHDVNFSVLLFFQGLKGLGAGCSGNVGMIEWKCEYFECVGVQGVHVFKGVVKDFTVVCRIQCGHQNQK